MNRLRAKLADIEARLAAATPPADAVDVEFAGVLAAVLQCDPAPGGPTGRVERMALALRCSGDEVLARLRRFLGTTR